MAEVTRACEVCGKEFRAREDKIALGLGKYCSVSCSGIGQRTRVKKTCGLCGNTFYVTKSKSDNGRGIYCSKKCLNASKKYTSAGSANPHWNGGKTTRTCKQCGAKFLVYKSAVAVGEGSFCSYECRNKSYRTGGEPEYPSSFNASFKKSIRKRDNYTCALCGYSPSLHVHHINYNKNDTYKWNCITLCIRCHTRTNRNREYWKSVLTPIVSVRQEEKHG